MKWQVSAYRLVLWVAGMGHSSSPWEVRSHTQYFESIRVGSNTRRDWEVFRSHWTEDWLNVLEEERLHGTTGIPGG